MNQEPLSTEQKTWVVQTYRQQYKSLVMTMKPWLATNVSAAFRHCGDVAAQQTCFRFEEDLEEIILAYLTAWRLETGLGLDQQLTLEGQLRDAA